LKQIRGMLFLFGAFTLAGTSVISARFVTGKLGTFTITAVSLFFALLCLIPLTGKKIRMTIRQMSALDWILLFVQALFGIFLFRMFLLFGLLHTSSAEAGILTGATPAITAIIAKVLLKETMTRKKWIGIFCTVSGILLVQGLFMPKGNFVLEHLIGNVLVLCASICESLFNTCSRIAVIKTQSNNKTSIHPLVQTTLVSAMALFLCIIPALFERPVQLLPKLELQQWLSLIWYGVFITALAFIFWYEGIKRCHASTAAAFSGMMPLTSLLLSVLLLGESADCRQWSGGFLIILGMVLIGYSKSQTMFVKKERNW
jgi:drug/metabolite transporter (DMT)-like permease